MSEGITGSPESGSHQRREPVNIEKRYVKQADSAAGRLIRRLQIAAVHLVLTLDTHRGTDLEEEQEDRLTPKPIREFRPPPEPGEDREEKLSPKP